MSGESTNAHGWRREGRVDVHDDGKVLDEVAVAGLGSGGGVFGESSIGDVGGDALPGHELAVFVAPRRGGLPDPRDGAVPSDDPILREELRFRIDGDRPLPHDSLAVGKEHDPIPEVRIADPRLGVVTGDRADRGAHVGDRRRPLGGELEDRRRYLLDQPTEPIGVAGRGGGHVFGHGRSAYRQIPGGVGGSGSGSGIRGRPFIA